MQKIKGRLQIEIRKAGDKEYYYLFRLPDGGIFISKFFQDILEVMSAAEKTKRSAMEESRYHHQSETASQFYFIFNIKKNTPVGQSSIYKDRPTMDYALRYMQKYMIEAEIVDLTT